MKKEARREEIVRLIDSLGEMDFKSLSEYFPKVSHMTLRSDLKALDSENRIIRTHGGLKAVGIIIGTDDFLSKKMIKNVKEKELIAAKALNLIKEDSCFFLDSGSTTTLLSLVIKDQSYLIYTTGLNCAINLARLTKARIVVPGGKLNRYSHSVYGHSAIREIERVNFDLAFIGVSAFDYELGFQVGSLEEAYLKEAAIKKAKKVIVLMDNSKIDKRKSFTIGNISDIDIIISDDKLPKQFIKLCEKNNVEIL